jgi:hypothetical protein
VRSAVAGFLPNAPSDPSVRALGSANDAKDDDHLGLDQIDDAKITDPKAPERRSGEFARAPGARFLSERQDRPSQASRLTGRESAKLPLCSRGEVDPTTTPDHSGSLP